MKDKFKNIDELFDQFQDQEVDYNPDSWNKMEDLLDQHMPVQKASSSILKKIAPHLLGLGLISSLSIGYFIVPKTSPQNLGQQMANNEVEVTETAGPKQPIKDWVMAAVEDNKEEQEENKVIYEKHFPSAKEKQIVSEVNISQDKQDAMVAEPTQTSKRQTNVIDKKQEQAIALATEELNKTKYQIQEIASKEAHFNSLKTINKEDVISVLKGKQRITKPEVEEYTSIQFNNKTYHQDITSGLIYEADADTLLKYVIVEKNQLVEEEIPTMDTISIYKVERVAYHPIPITNQLEILEGLKAEKELELANIKNAKINNIKYDFKENNHVLASTKKNITNKKNTDWLNKVFNGQSNNYAYLLFGMNGLIGSQLNGGGHLGFGIGRLIGEKWSINADLKYTNYFMRQFHFEDQGANYELNKYQSNGNWNYTGSGNTVNNQYTIDYFQKLTLTTNINYQLAKNFSIAAGIFGVYNLPMKYRVNQEFRSFDINETADQSNLFQDKDLQINPEKDFKSSFSLGYIVGLQYDINNKWSANGKVYHPIVNSYKSQMTYLSKMVNAPTVELSIGYYFGRKDKIRYIMDIK